MKKKPEIVKWIELPVSFLMSMYITIAMVVTAKREKYSKESWLEALTRISNRDSEMWAWWSIRWVTIFSIIFYSSLIIIFML